jgi:MFS family permease
VPSRSALALGSTDAQRCYAGKRRQARWPPANSERRGSGGRWISSVLPFPSAVGRPHFGPNAWLLLLTSAGGAISIGVFGVIFNLYVVSLGISSGALGVILGVGTLGLALAVAPAGLLADAWGRKRTLILGGILNGVATVGQCLFPSAAAIAACGFVGGLGGAAIAVVALPMLLEAAPPGQRNAVLATGGALALLGSAAGSVLGGRLPAWFGNVLAVAPNGPLAYRLTLLLSLALAGVTALPLLPWYHDRHRPRSWRRGIAGLADPAWRRLAGKMALVVGALGLGAGFVIPYLNLYFTRVLGVSVAAFGTLGAVSQLVLGAMTLLAGVLTARYGVVRLVVLTQLLAIAVLLFLAAAPAPAAAMAAFVMRQGLMDMTSPIAQGWLLGLAAPEQRATTSSLLLIAQQGPWALSSAAGGALQQRAGFLPGFLLTALFYLLSVAFWIAFFRRTTGRNGQQIRQFGILREGNPQEAPIE